MVYLMVTICMSQWSEQGKEWAGAMRESALSAKTAAEFPPFGKNFMKNWGYLAVFDWTNKKIVAAKKLQFPFGPLMVSSDPQKSFRDRMFVPTWKYNEILVLEGSKLVKIITHPTFSHVHNIDLIPDSENPSAVNLLLSSSGTDLVAEVSQNGEMRREWWAFDHGYDKTKRGETLNSSNFDKEFDYRHCWAPTARQTTHVNCVIAYDANSWLATLPVVGQLVHVDRKTGNAKVILEHLAFPHSIRPRANKEQGFILSNTLANEVIYLTKDLKKEKVLKFNIPLTWIQDCMEFPNGHLLLLTNRKLPLDDFGPEDPKDTNLIVETDAEGNILTKVDAHKDNRLYCAETITQQEAEYWAAAFQKDSASQQTLEELTSVTVWLNDTNDNAPESKKHKSH